MILLAHTEPWGLTIYVVLLLNNSLLKDEEYIQKIKHVIKENIVMYSVDEVSYDELELDKCNFENYRFSIDDQLFFNTLLMMIRGETILYSSVKKKRGVKNETKLEKEISDLETKSIYDVDNKDVIEELEDKKNSLEDLRKQKVEDAILRSKLEWMEFGEKPSKFFLNLEKQNRINRQIKTLIDDQGNIILNKNVPFEIHRFTLNCININLYLILIGTFLN